MSKRQIRRQATSERAAAFVDARNLVMELAGRVPAASVNPMSAGIVLDRQEQIRRVVGAWMRVAMTDGTWSVPSWGRVFVTDQRLLVRHPGGALHVIWWGDLVGFAPDLPGDQVPCDFGGGAVTLLSGTDAAVLAVEGIYVLYGVEGLLSHPALDDLRAGQYLSQTT